MSIFAKFFKGFRKQEPEPATNWPRLTGDARLIVSAHMSEDERSLLLRLMARRKVQCMSAMLRVLIIEAAERELGVINQTPEGPAEKLAERQAAKARAKIERAAVSYMTDNKVNTFCDLKDLELLPKGRKERAETLVALCELAIEQTAEGTLEFRPYKRSGPVKYMGVRLSRKHVELLRKIVLEKKLSWNKTLASILQTALHNGYC